MKKQKKLNIIQTISLGITIVLSIITILTGAMLLRSFFVLHEGALEKRIETSIDGLRWELEKNRLDINQISSSLVTRMDLHYYLDPDGSFSNWQLEEYFQKYKYFWEDIQNIHGKTILNLSIFSTNEQMILPDCNHFLVGKMQNPDIYHALMNSEDDYLCDLPRVNEDEMKIVLPFYKKVLDINQEKIIGVIEIEIAVSELINENAQIEQNVNQILFDRNKEILCSSQEIDKEFMNTITNALHESTKTAIVSQGETKYMLLFDRDEYFDLYFVALHPFNANQAFFREKQHINYILLPILLLLMVAIIYFIIRSKLKPLVTLGEAIDINSNESLELLTRDLSIHNENEVTKIISYYHHMFRKLQGLEQDNARVKQAKKTAELQALQAQINPHFLYNTLENLRMQCEIDEYYELSDKIAVLSDLFRFSVNWKEKVTTLEKEFENLRNYLYIMEMRFMEALQYELLCDIEVYDFIIPKLILQPLVENCFKHGFKDKEYPWIISVIAKKEGAKVHIIIRDNGWGIPKEKLEKLMSGSQDDSNSIGIENVQQRLKGIYPKTSSFLIQSQELNGTKISITIGEKKT